MQKDSNLSAIKKTLELIQSEVDSEPIQKSFTDSLKRDSQTNFFPSKNRENSAIMIQSHIRKYLAQKKYKRVKDSFSLEDNEVKSIICGWKKDSHDLKKDSFMTDFKMHNEGQLDSLQKLKAEEIHQIKSAIKESGESSQIIDTITKIINSRYQNIAKIMQAKYENKHGIVAGGGLLYRISEDSEGLEEFDRSESFSDSYKEDKVWSQTTETAANTKDNSVTPSKSESKLQIPQEIWAVDPELQKYSLNPSPNHTKMITSESVSSLAEKILQQFLNTEISKYVKPPTDSPQSDPTPTFDFFLQSGIEFILKRFDKIEKSLTRPLRKNPLEVLAKVQSPYTVNPLKWCFTGYPNVIPPNFCEEFSKTGNFHDMGTNRHQLKMFFDCCNEIIQKIRPFGEDGAPMPWSFTKPQRPLKIDKNTFGEFLGEKIEAFNSISAGKIPDNEFLTGENLNEEKLHRTREEKIGVLIAQDIKTNEKVWIDYEFEHIQAKVLLADKIFEILLKETIDVVSDSN